MEAKSRSVHPLVSLDYRVRVPAMFMVGLVLASYFWDYPRSFWLWTAIVFTGIVWPQLGHLAARLSPDTKAAELRNLLFDARLLHGARRRFSRESSRAWAPTAGRPKAPTTRGPPVNRTTLTTGCSGSLGRRPT